MPRAQANKAQAAKGWRTKWGWRSVRVELPTLDEALDAAAGLTSDSQQQIELAADLLKVPVSQVRAAAERIIENRARAPERQSIRSRPPVVVERRGRRHFAAVPAHRRSP